MPLSTVTPIAPTQPLDGLCGYDDPEMWFNRKASDQARAANICSNCPVAAACGQAALDLDVTDGVWAGVVLPGKRSNKSLDQARENLRKAVERFRHQHPAQRRRALVIRAAVRHAASREHARQLIDEAIRYADGPQRQALNGLRDAVDTGRRRPPLHRGADLMIREAVHYAAQQKSASAPQGSKSIDHQRTARPRPTSAPAALVCTGSTPQRTDPPHSVRTAPSATGNARRVTRTRERLNHGHHARHLDGTRQSNGAPAEEGALGSTAADLPGGSDIGHVPAFAPGVADTRSADTWTTEGDSAWRTVAIFYAQHWPNVYPKSPTVRWKSSVPHENRDDGPKWRSTRGFEPSTRPVYASDGRVYVSPTSKPVWVGNGSASSDSIPTLSAMSLTLCRSRRREPRSSTLPGVIFALSSNRPTIPAPWAGQVTTCVSVVGLLAGTSRCARPSATAGDTTIPPTSSAPRNARQPRTRHDRPAAPALRVPHPGAPSPPRPYSHSTPALVSNPQPRRRHAGGPMTPAHPTPRSAPRFFCAACGLTATYGHPESTVSKPSTAPP